MNGKCGKLMRRGEVAAKHVLPLPEEATIDALRSLEVERSLVLRWF